MSARNSSADSHTRRAGFSLMEVLVVLAIFAMAVAIVMPSTGRMMDQATAHAVFFDFQRQVSDLRREANRTGQALRLVDPAGGGQTAPDADVRTVTLREPWRYTLAPALDIAAGGACSPTTANLLNGDRVVMTLISSDADCRFMRQATTAAPPRAPASE